MAPSRAFALTCLLALVAAASGAGDFGLPAPFDDSPNATDVTANVTAQGRHLLDGSVANTTATCPTALEVLDAHQLSTYPLLVEASGLTALVSTPGLSHLVPVEEAFSVFFTSNNVSFSPSSVTSPGFCCAAKGNVASFVKFTTVKDPLATSSRSGNATKMTREGNALSRVYPFLKGYDLVLKVPAVTAAPEELYWPYQKGHCNILKSIPTCGGGFVHLLDGVPQPFKL